MNIFNDDARIRVQDFSICDFLLRCVFTRLYRYIEAPARSEHKVAIGKCKKIQTVHGASCGMWRLANQVLVSGKNCCNQRQAVVVLALKAIWAICKSYQKLSKAPSHGVEMSQWRSWDPNFVLYGGPGRLAVWTALARWLQGALAAASVVHLQSLANVLSSRGHSKLRCIIGTYTDLRCSASKNTKSHERGKLSRWFMMIRDVLDMFRVSLGLCLCRHVSSGSFRGGIAASRGQKAYMCNSSGGKLSDFFHDKF